MSDFKRGQRGFEPRIPQDQRSQAERAIAWEALTVKAPGEPAFAEAHATAGSFCFVRVFETHQVGAGGPPAPPELFMGPQDELRAYDLESGSLEPRPKVGAGLRP